MFRMQEQRYLCSCLALLPFELVLSVTSGAWDTCVWYFAGMIVPGWLDSSPEEKDFGISGDTPEAVRGWTYPNHVHWDPETPHALG